MKGRNVGAAAALVSVGGLVAAGGTAADWVTRTATRDVGGVPIAEPVTTSGTEIAPQLVTVGLAAVALGLVLIVAPRAVRRAVAAVAAVVGVIGLLVGGLGLARAASLPGALAAGPGIAGLGVLAVLAGGVLALRADGRSDARPSLPSRYSLEEPDPAGEWRMASADTDE